MRSKIVSAASAVLATAAFFCLAPPTASAGNPVPGVDVSLEQIPGGVRGEAKSDPNGNFEFKGLAKGRYRVVVKARKPDPRGGPSYAEDHNSSRSNLSTIAGPGEPEVVRALIELRHSDERGAAILPVDVVITSENGGTIRGCLFTPEDRLDTGDWLFDPKECKALLSGEVVLRREAAGVRTFIVAGNAFKGTLVAKDGKSPVGGVRVTCSGRGSMLREGARPQATTREDGTFALDIPNDWTGEFVISPQGESGRYRFKYSQRVAVLTDDATQTLIVFAPPDDDAAKKRDPVRRPPPPPRTPRLPGK